MSMYGWQSRTHGYALRFEGLDAGQMATLRFRPEVDVYVVGFSGDYNIAHTHLTRAPLRVQALLPQEQPMHIIPMPWEAVVGTAEHPYLLKSPNTIRQHQDLIVEVTNDSAVDAVWGTITLWAIPKEAVPHNVRPEDRAFQMRTQIHSVRFDSLPVGGVPQTRAIVFDRPGYLWNVSGAKWSTGGASDVGAVELKYGFADKATVVDDWSRFVGVIGSGQNPFWYKAPLPVGSKQSLQVQARNSGAGYSISTQVCFQSCPES